MGGKLWDTQGKLWDTHDQSDGKRTTFQSVIDSGLMGVPELVCQNWFSELPELPGCPRIGNSRIGNCLGVPELGIAWVSQNWPPRIGRRIAWVSQNCQNWPNWPPQNWPN
jgi:hypothetical protein